MLKKKFAFTSILCLVFQSFFFSAAAADDAPPEIPATVAGTLTVNGAQVTGDSGADYLFSITRTDGTAFNPPAEYTGLNPADWYVVEIPINASGQTDAANPGDPAVIHVFQDGTEITVNVPAEGALSVGSAGSVDIINLECTGGSSPAPPPRADAGQDQTVASGDPVTLDGTASVPGTSGDTLTFSWEQISGSPAVSLSNPAVSSPTFSAPSLNAGLTADLTFRLTVTGPDSQTDDDTVIIHVQASSVENQLPVADAGQNQTVSTGQTVLLDGSGSTDPDVGDTLTFAWTQVSGTVVTLSDPSSENPQFTAPAPVSGDTLELTFRLTVTDSKGEQDVSTVTVTVKDEQKAPVANTGPDQNVESGAEVELDGSNSTAFGEGNAIVAFRWQQIGETDVSLSNPNQQTASFTAPAVNRDGRSLTFELTVTDRNGLTGTAETRVNVLGDNHPPRVDAGPAQNVFQGEIVTLNGSNSTDPDPDDQIVSYVWHQISGPSVQLSDSLAALATFTAPPTGNGGISLEFQLTVTDSGGLQASDTVAVNVSSPDNRPPVADAGNDLVVREGESVTLDGSGSYDADGNLDDHIWEQISGTPVTLSDPKAVGPVFSAPEVGRSGQTLTFKLTVTDKGGLKHSSQVMVTVVNTGFPPEASAGSDQHVTSGETVYLDSTGTIDPDGWITSYVWNQISGSPASLSDPLAPNPFFTAPETGAEDILMTFRLVAVDNEGLKGSDLVTVTVEASYQGLAPVADAGEDQVLDEGYTALLDGSGSFAREGEIDSYHWIQTGGPSVYITDPGSPRTTFLVPGVDNNSTALSFILTVTDSSGLKDSDQTSIRIIDLGDGPGEEDSACFIQSLK